MEDRKTGVSSVAELMEEDDHRGKRALVIGAACILIALGLLFTGYLNFMLYGRAFSGEMKVLGLVPAILIEGSLAVFLLGSFVWFAQGAQGTLAKIFGWAMFGIVAFNCIVEFNALTDGGLSSDFIRIYAQIGVPVVIPVVVGFWKAVLDTDPAIAIMRQKRKIAQTIQIAKLNAYMTALGKESARAALTAYGDRTAEEVNARLRGEQPAPARLQAPAQIVPGWDTAPRHAGETLAKDQPMEVDLGDERGPKA